MKLPESVFEATTSWEGSERPLPNKSQSLLAVRPRVSEKHRADVAQLVEQLIRNQQVSGSNPLVGSRLPRKMRTCSGALFSLGGVLGGMGVFLRLKALPVPIWMIQVALLGYLLSRNFISKSIRSLRAGRSVVALPSPVVSGPRCGRERFA